jgi:hypothetical protein
VQSADDFDSDDEEPERHGMSASAEIGALNEEKVTECFRTALPAIQECLSDGAKRVEFLGGEIAFFIKINQSRSIEHIHAEQSTLGDRRTEKCMFDALRAAEWPAPEGGDLGIARNSFEFDMPNDVRPPTIWESSQLDGEVGALRSQLGACDRATAPYTATLYVDTEGTPISASLVPPDESGEAAVDCMVDVLMAAKYPSPGSWPAKVVFSL